MIQIEVAQEIFKQMQSGECDRSLLIEGKSFDLKFIGVDGIAGKIYDVTLTLE
jgi:hypothetical protein